jgi:3-deoxy-manno-octulosonate cytidylyltransferase (CMP-KDO synthetase)
MTRTDHVSGTDRVWEAAARFPEAEAVVNVQGDEPFLDPNWIEAICSRLNEPLVELVTAAAPWWGDPADPSAVKVWVNELGLAVDFSRDASRVSGPYRRHQGIYGFRRSALADFVGSTQSLREINERLEQLRWLEAGRPIHVVEVDQASISVDTPADLERARVAVIGRPGLFGPSDEPVS